MPKRKRGESYSFALNVAAVREHLVYTVHQIKERRAHYNSQTIFRSQAVVYIAAIVDAVIHENITALRNAKDMDSKAIQDTLNNGFASRFDDHLLGYFYRYRVSNIREQKHANVVYTLRLVGIVVDAMARGAVNRMEQFKRKTLQIEDFRYALWRLAPQISPFTVNTSLVHANAVQLVKNGEDFPSPDSPVPVPPIIEHDVEVGEEKKDEDDKENNDDTEDEDDKENNDDTEDEDDKENQEPDTNECRLYIEQTLPSQVQSLFHHAHNRFRTMNDLRLLELKNKYVTLKIRISQKRAYPYWANLVPIRAVDSGPIRAIDIVSVGFNVACRGQKGFDTIIRTLTPLSKRYQLPIRVECVVNPSFAQYFRVSDKYVAADLYQFGGGDSYYLKETLPGQF